MADAGDDELFAVLIARDPRLIDVPAAADALAPLEPGLSPFDLRSRLRYAGGVVETSAPALHAAELVRALADAGIDTVRIPAASLPALPPARRVWQLARTEAGWRLWLGPAGGHLAPPQVDVSADALGLVHGFALETPAPAGTGRPLHPDEAAAKRAGEGGPLGQTAALLSAQLARRGRRGRPVRLAIDLFVGGARYRLERGVRWPTSGTQHSLEAFAALLADLAARAPAALSAETRSLAAGILEPSVLAHPEELARFERWLLARGQANPEGAGLL